MGGGTVKMPKSFWPEYSALVLFVSGPIGGLVFTIWTLL